MSRSRDRSLPEKPGRTLVLAGAVLLICILTLSGCTQPIIPTPGPAQTTQVPVATTAAPTAPPATPAPVTTKGSDYLTYVNAQRGFSLSYPGGWTKQEGTGTTVVSFTSPSSGMGETPATVRVSTEDLSANPMSLEQYKNAQLAKKQALDRFNIIYDQAQKISGINGWKIGYTYDSGTLMKTFEVYVIRGNTAYTLSLSSKEDKFAGFSVDMDTITKSFQLTG